MTSQAPHQIVTITSRNIRTARLEAGHTQSSLARSMEMDVRAVNRWERGGITPSSRSLARLAVLLDRDPGWFYTDHDRSAAA